jgi:hypothetical protein
MDLLRFLFPGLGYKSVKMAHGNKNGSFTKKGPGRFALLRKPPKAEDATARSN